MESRIVNRDTFTIGVYLIQMHMMGFALPFDLPMEVMDRLLTWLKESPWILSQSEAELNDTENLQVSNPLLHLI